MIFRNHVSCSNYHMFSFCFCKIKHYCDVTRKRNTFHEENLDLNKQLQECVLSCLHYSGSRCIYKHATKIYKKKKISKKYKPHTLCMCVCVFVYWCDYNSIEYMCRHLFYRTSITIITIIMAIILYFKIFI